MIGARVSIADRFPYSPGPDRRGVPAGYEEHLPYRYGFGVDEGDPRRFDLTDTAGFSMAPRSLLLPVVMGAVVGVHL